MTHSLFTTHLEQTKRDRPRFPSRAIITAGMPYGNKSLHFGHVGGLFIHADTYARFLRDRLGPENVIFVSGTDCYGSAIEVTYSDLVASGEYSGTIEDFVRKNHDHQEAVLHQYGVVPDLYAASALDEAGEIHCKLSQEIFERLYEQGYLELVRTKQFFDEAEGVYLNGRQVRGRCPIQGCKSESAYADECALGHQFSPDELIAPVSALSGQRPVLREVLNWCFDLERFRPLIASFVEKLNDGPTTRRTLTSVIEEFLKPPSVYVKKDYREAIEELRGVLPAMEVLADDSKSSDELVFASLDDRAKAVSLLSAEGIRYRTGKTLVPFRLSGNVAWGIPIPEHEGAKDLTFWVWPESLWAPISFTRAALRARGASEDAWKDWWMSKDSRVYQFIGEDNIYFYSVAQTGLFMALQAAQEKSIDPPDGDLQLTTVVPNRHVLYQKKKASSSGAAKPPSAEELLSYYSKDQLRMHFFHMNLGQTSVGFSPKAVLEPDKRGEYDPVVYEGNLLTNIYNRLIRSCFYTLQKYFADGLPDRPVGEDAKAEADRLIIDYENAMYRFEFNRVFDLLDQYLRGVNKRWAAESKKVEDMGLQAALLVDSFHAVRTAATLLHPLVPEGTERVREYLNVDERLWDWTYIFEPLAFFTAGDPAHALKFLEPRVDFFEKPENQYQ